MAYGVEIRNPSGTLRLGMSDSTFKIWSHETGTGNTAITVSGMTTGTDWGLIDLKANTYASLDAYPEIATGQVNLVNYTTLMAYDFLILKKQ